MNFLNKILFLSAIGIVSSYPVVDDYQNINCYNVIEYYTPGIIINNSILKPYNETYHNHSKYSNNITIKNIATKKPKYHNITFEAQIQLKYKTLPHCHYICDMMVSGDEKTGKFISDHFENLFHIGGILHMMCNNTLCKWYELTCTSHYIKDEL